MEFFVEFTIFHVSYITRKDSLSERQTWEIAYQYWRDEGIFKFHITMEKLVELRLCYTTVTICDFENLLLKSSLSKM